MVGSLPGSKLYHAQHRKRAVVQEARKQGKSTELEAHMPWDVTGRPMMANEVAVATSMFFYIHLSSSFLLLLILNFAFFLSFIRHCK